MYTDPQILYNTTLSLDMNARHRYFMHLYHHYTDTVVHWTWYYIIQWSLLLHVLVIHRLLLHIYVPLVHGYPIHRIPHFILLLSSLRGCSVHSYVYTSLLHMHVLFLYSCLMEHRSYCMQIHVFLLHDCFTLLILIFPLLDMWAVDMWCVKLSATWIQATWATSRISHILFPVFHYLISCYQ